MQYNKFAVLLLVALCCTLVTCGKKEPIELKQGGSFKLGTLNVTVSKMDIVPFVENEFSRIYVYDTHENPKLDILRVQEKLDEVIAPGIDEFDKQLHLLEWVHHRLKRHGRVKVKPRGALEILQAADEGHILNCGFYSTALVSMAGSLGWTCRAIGLKGAESDGNGRSHSLNEIWSGQYRKWVMFDPLCNIYFEKDGIPLNAYETRTEWFVNQGKDLKIVKGKTREKYSISDLPVFIKYHEGFGRLDVNTRSLDKLAIISYIPNLNLMDAGPDYGNMFITRDAYAEGIVYHTRKNPEDPARDPYFPINQAALTLTPLDKQSIRVRIRTITPNFKTFKVRLDGITWTDTGGSLVWDLHAGKNSLEAVSVNKYGVQGPVSQVECEAADQAVSLSVSRPFTIFTKPRMNTSSGSFPQRMGFNSTGREPSQTIPPPYFVLFR